MIDGPFWGLPTDTNPADEVWTVKHPEPAFEPDDWPEPWELADDN